MSAKDLQTVIEIPWIPGSTITIRPMTLADERKLISNSKEMKAYRNLIKDCVIDSKNFDWSRDYSMMEHAYLLAKIRQITYGDELAISGYKCPKCEHNNQNHLVYISQIPTHEVKTSPLLYKMERSPSLEEYQVISHPSLEKVDKIQDIIQGMRNDNKSEDEIMAKFLELQLLSVFRNIDLEKAQEYSESGEISPYDVKKANKLLELNPYGLNLKSKMKCHKCGTEFPITIHILGSGFLVPYFD